jgi:hypothetical protein
MDEMESWNRREICRRLVDGSSNAACSLTVVRQMTSLPLRATTAEVQLESQECEQLLPMFALRDASTYRSPT